MGEPKSDIELFSFSASRSLSHVVNEIGKYIEVPTKEYLELDGVRITPSSLVFENVYEGKTFELTMTIQNCGKKTAFIRICPPRSHVSEILFMSTAHNFVHKILKMVIKYHIHTEYL